MKRSTSTLFVVLAFGMPFALQAEEPLDLSDPEVKIGYAVGATLGKMLAPGRDIVDADSLVRGFFDAMAGAGLAMEEAEIETIYRGFQSTMRRKITEEQSAKGKQFLEGHAKKEGVKILPSGLQYRVLTKGTGASPKATDKVKTHYRGSFIDGKEFDSSYSRGEPATFPVNRVIPGWTEALQLMKEGGKWELAIPFNLAYGERGSPPRIPPFATLVFEVELIEIVTN